MLQYDFAILYGGGSAYNALYGISRSPVFNDTYAIMFDSFVKSTGFDIPIYTVPQPSTCFYGGPGQSPPIVENVNPAQITGVWYQHYIDVSQLVFQGGATACATAKLSPILGTAVLLDTSTSQSGPANVGPSEPISVLKANVTQTGALGGNFVVTFPPGTAGPGSPGFSQPLTFIDLVSSALTAAPYEFAIQSNGPAFSAIFAISRTPTLPTIYMQRFMNFIDKYHFWLNIYTVPQLDGCFYGPNGLPAPIPTLNLTMFQGRYFQHRVDINQLQFQVGLEMVNKKRTRRRKEQQDNK